MKRTGHIRDHLSRVTKADHGKTALTGIMEGQTYPDGELVAQVGYWNDYGTKDIPPRPFFRTGVSDSKDEAMRVLGVSLEKGNTVEHSLLLAAEVVKDSVVGKIITWSDPPNAASTIRDKGFDAPLRGPDRLLRNSITTAIESE